MKHMYEITVFTSVVAESEEEALQKAKFDIIHGYEGMAEITDKQEVKE